MRPTLEICQGFLIFCGLRKIQHLKASPQKGQDLKIIVQFHVLHFYNYMTLKAITLVIKPHDFYLRDGFCTFTTFSAKAILH